MDLGLRHNLTLTAFLILYHGVVLFRKDRKSLVIARQMAFGPTVKVQIQSVERVDQDCHACGYLIQFEAFYRLLAHCEQHHD